MIAKDKICDNSQQPQDSVSSQKECQDACVNYLNCEGISFRSSDSACFLCDSEKLKEIGAPGFTFYKKPKWI